MSGTHEASGNDGRWTFRLSPFTDTLQTSAAPHLTLELAVGPRRLPVAKIVTHLHVKNIQATTTMEDGKGLVLLTFQENKPLRGRVARLWALDRSWEAPVSVPIPDQQTERASLQDVLPGRYIAEDRDRRRVGAAVASGALV